MGAGDPVQSAKPAPDPAGLTIEVENHNFSDATIYAFDSGNRLRLGRVTGKTTQSFTFRWYQNELQIIVDFTGGGWIVSDKQPVYPGVDDNLRLIIGSADHRWAATWGK